MFDSVSSTMSDKNTKLRVLRVSSYPTLSRGGMGLPAYQLSQDEHYETLYRAAVLDPTETHKEAPPALKDIKYIPFHNKAFPQDRRLSWALISMLFRRVFAIFVFAWKVLSSVRLKDVDVLHAHSPMFALIACVLKILGKSTVVTIHGTDFTRIVESRFAQILLLPFDRVLCVSQAFVVELKKIYPDKDIRPVYNGVDGSIFKAQEDGKKKKNVIVNVGTLRWHKDQASLIQAMVRVHKEYPDWILKIVGEGELRGELEKKISDCGLQDVVELCGAVPQQEVSRILSESKLFVLSSVTEGLPKALLEAMACGCACVSTDVGECASVMSGAGKVINKESVVELEESILALVGNENELKTVSERCVSKAEGYGWDKYRQLHRSIYSELVEE